MAKMKRVTSLKILIIITSVVCLLATYAMIAKSGNSIQDEVIQRWANIYPLYTLISGLISLAILLFSFKYSGFLFDLLGLAKTVKIAALFSLPFILFATAAWFYNSGDADQYQLGDAIWKLGHPLTFIVIDLPIYLKMTFEDINFVSYNWMYPLVIVLFVLQFVIFTHGLRIILNIKHIRRKLTER